MEEAIIFHWVKIIASYLRTADPSPLVAQTLVVHLREMPHDVARLRELEIEPGPRLLFKVRTGRPPKERPSLVEEVTVRGAISSGSEVALAFCLETGTLNRGDWELIAEAFDPNGKTKYKLVFEKNRPQRGNPITTLRADLEMNTLLVASEQLKKHYDSTGARCRITIDIPAGLKEMGLLKTDDDTRLKKSKRRQRDQAKPTG
jgi:hypothetical protein